MHIPLLNTSILQNNVNTSVPEFQTLSGHLKCGLYFSQGHSYPPPHILNSSPQSQPLSTSANLSNKYRDKVCGFHGTSSRLFQPGFLVFASVGVFPSGWPHEVKTVLLKKKKEALIAKEKLK